MGRQTANGICWETRLDGEREMILVGIVMKMRGV